MVSLVMSIFRSVLYFNKALSGPNKALSDPNNELSESNIELLAHKRVPYPIKETVVTIEF